MIRGRAEGPVSALLGRGIVESGPRTRRLDGASVRASLKETVCDEASFRCLARHIDLTHKPQADAQYVFDYRAALGLLVLAGERSDLAVTNREMVDGQPAASPWDRVR